MRPSTIAILIGLLLIAIPIPVLPPLVGTISGVFFLLGGLLLRLLGV